MFLEKSTRLVFDVRNIILSEHVLIRITTLINSLNDSINKIKQLWGDDSAKHRFVQVFVDEFLVTLGRIHL